MKIKKFITFGILVVVLGAIFIPTHAVHASWFGVPTPSDLVDVAFKGLGFILMTVSAFVLTISGYIFDKVISFTIVDMAKNIGDPNGVGGAITTAWATLRDVANMCFIFVLLYAAFKAMFELNFSGLSTTIRNIIIVALLINFSLFFSKVVIDASNIVAVGFYNSISNQNTVTLSSVSGSPTPTTSQTGISAGYMNMLGLQTFYDSRMLDNLTGGPTQIMTISIMSSVFMLITAVVLLMAGVMFAARFIILVLLMILSPLALIAFIIPGMKNQFDKWKSSLIDQSFFAPIFFALTWVVFKLGNALIKAVQDPSNTAPVSWANLTTNPQSTVTLIFNYVLIIGFSIAALVISKTVASRGATGGAFKAISGGIGTGVIGGAGLAARNTIGRGSKYISENKREEWSKSTIGRAGLWMADKGGKSSFDVRSLADSKAGKAVGAGKILDSSVFGKAAGKGGFNAAVDTKEKAKAKYAKDVYGQTGAEKDEAGRLKGEYEKLAGEDGKKVKDAVKKEEGRIRAEREAEEKKAEKAKNNATKEVEEKEKIANQLKADRQAGIMVNPEEEARVTKEVEEARLKLKTTTETHELALEKIKADIEKKDYTEATKALLTETEKRKRAWEDVKNAGAERQRAYAERLENSKVKNVATAIGSGLLSGSVGAVAGGVVGSVLGPAGTIAGASIGGGIGARIGVKTRREGNKAAARKVREQAREKSKAEKAADAARDYQKEQDEASGTAPEASAAAPSASPAATPSAPAAPSGGGTKT